MYRHYWLFAVYLCVISLLAFAGMGCGVGTPTATGNALGNATLDINAMLTGLGWPSMGTISVVVTPMSSTQGGATNSLTLTYTNGSAPVTPIQLPAGSYQVTGSTTVSTWMVTGTSTPNPVQLTANKTSDVTITFVSTGTMATTPTITVGPNPANPSQNVLTFTFDPPTSSTTCADVTIFDPPGTSLLASVMSSVANASGDLTCQLVYTPTSPPTPILITVTPPSGPGQPTVPPITVIWPPTTPTGAVSLVVNDFYWLSYWQSQGVNTAITTGSASFTLNDYFGGYTNVQYVATQGVNAAECGSVSPASGSMSTNTTSFSIVGIMPPQVIVTPKPGETEMDPGVVPCQLNVAITATGSNGVGTPDISDLDLTTTFFYSGVTNPN